MFDSKFKRIGKVLLPEFTGLRIMMMPIVIGDYLSIPPTISTWQRVIVRMWDYSFYLFGTDRDIGKVGYLTIDEKLVNPGKSQRRPGLHVDGIYRGGPGPWGGGAPWASVGTGAITVSSHPGCRAWLQSFEGWPGPEGECDHLASQCRPECEIVFEAGVAYWFDGLCVHESIIQPESVPRQFVRLSLPSTAPWFEGYTKNPLGIIPAGEILPRREYMDA